MEGLSGSSDGGPRLHRCVHGQRPLRQHQLSEAYYGITTGRTDEEFAPDANVTRSQMALFLARAADAAGIDLGESTDQGFTDLNADDTERVDAINLLVGAGIMFGDTETSFDPPSTTVFGPTDQVSAVGDGNVPVRVP